MTALEGVCLFVVLDSKPGVDAPVLLYLLFHSSEARPDLAGNTVSIHTILRSRILSRPMVYANAALRCIQGVKSAVAGGPGKTVLMVHTRGFLSSAMPRLLIQK